MACQLTTVAQLVDHLACIADIIQPCLVTSTVQLKDKRPR